MRTSLIDMAPCASFPPLLETKKVIKANKTAILDRGSENIRANQTHVPGPQTRHLER